MSNSTKISKAFNYVSYVKALLTGDTAEATALKNKALTRSILEMQISAKKHELTRALNSVEQLQVAETNAFVNDGKYIDNEDEWINAVTEAGNAIIHKQAEITKIRKMVEKLEELLKRVED